MVKLIQIEGSNEYEAAKYNQWETMYVNPAHIVYVCPYEGVTKITLSTGFTLWCQQSCNEVYNKVRRRAPHEVKIVQR